MQHNLFKPKTFNEAQHAVVGDCNGFSMKDRWEQETPAFAEKILYYAYQVSSKPRILDYGCGCGRLAKAIVDITFDDIKYDLPIGAIMPEVVGTDASEEMLFTALNYVKSDRFHVVIPESLMQLEDKFDIIYCVYVLQHCPAIEMRTVLNRIKNMLKPGGLFIYCSSDYRMAIRFDNQGFFDDRFLGVNIRDEIVKLFDQECELFLDSELDRNQLLKKMITGCNNGLSHPAFVYKHKKQNPNVKNNGHDLIEIDVPKNCVVEANQNEPVKIIPDILPDGNKLDEIISEIIGEDNKNSDKIPKCRKPQKLVLINDLSPGDILLTSIAIRSLHRSHPGKYETDMRSPCNELFEHNPFITKIVNPNPDEEREVIERLKKNENLGTQESNGILYVISHYPEIHRSGMTGLSFTDGHRLFLAKQLDIEIAASGMNADFYFYQDEVDRYFNELSQFKQLKDKRYWVINAGIKNDYTLKQYPRYQEVVNLLKDRITFVQIGHMSHDHKPLDNVIDLRGKTNLRQLAALIYKADGVLTPISLPMHLAAVWNKPCVVPAGAREGARWEMYPNQRFLYYNGSMKCAPENGDGCWKSKIDQCVNKDVSGNAMCMSMIRAIDIVYAIESYYIGGRLDLLKNDIYGEYIDISSDKNKPCDDIDDIDFFKGSEEVETYRSPQITASIFNTLRILKGITPQDTYYEAYKWHFYKRGQSFMDTYHFMWYLSSVVKPKRILEIGCRTGISICQLLSATIDYSHIEKIVLIDLFNDGLCSPDLIKKHMHALSIPADIIGKVIFAKTESNILLSNLSEKGIKFDYILVDGCHDKEYAKSDLNYAAQIIDIDGYIVFDDITEDGCSLQDVWDEFKAVHNGDFSFWENHDGKGIGYAKRTR